MSASAVQNLNFGKELNGSKCIASGAPVINVNEQVLNTVDSGIGGNNWAFDNTNRTIQVYEQSLGTYCAVIRYQGQFDSEAGQQSPGNTEELDGDEDGSFEGGYRGTITGTLKTEPDWVTHGSVGTTDYRCDISGNCPGYISWLGQYFEGGYTFTYDWWGWIYRSPNHGVLVNAVTGNSGDIN